MSSVIIQSQLTDPLQLELSRLLSKETADIKLLDFLFLCLEQQTFFSRKASYIISMVLPFRSILPLYILNYEQEKTLSEKVDSPYIWGQWYQHFNQISINYRYQYLLQNPNLIELEKFKSVHHIDDALFGNTISNIAKTEWIIEQLNKSSEYKQELNYIIRNNDILKGLFYIFNYLQFSEESINQLLSVCNICLIQNTIPPNSSQLAQT